MRARFAIAMAACLVAACARRAPPTITRSAPGPEGGEPVVREGPYVSPYQYEHFLRAELALEAGAAALAAREYSAALTGSADDPLLRGRLVVALARSGEFDAARRAWAEAHRRFPNAESTWMSAAELASLEGRSADQLSALERAEECAPTSAAPVLARVELLRTLGREEEARSALRRYAERTPESLRATRVLVQLALSDGDLEAAATALRSRNVDVSDDTLDLRREVARRALAGAKPELTLELLSTVPISRLDRELRIRAHLALDRVPQAEALLARSGPADFDDPYTYISLVIAARRPDLAYALLTAGPSLASSQGAEVEPADRAERGARARNPMPTPRHVGPTHAYWTGVALLRLGRPTDAASWLSAVPEGAPMGPLARDALREALRASGVRGLAEEID